MNLRQILPWMSLYIPYISAGIRVNNVAKDGSSLDVEMKLRWWNKNAVGTHFGGSLYAMCDPFYMLILMVQLGPSYIVWDKSATINFLKPGRGTVHAHFAISNEEVALIRQKCEENYKYEPQFSVNVVDDSLNIIATVHKTLYVRKKI